MVKQHILQICPYICHLQLRHVCYKFKFKLWFGSVTMMRTSSQTGANGTQVYMSHKAIQVIREDIWALFNQNKVQDQLIQPNDHLDYILISTRSCLEVESLQSEFRRKNYSIYKPKDLRLVLFEIRLALFRTFWI